MIILANCPPNDITVPTNVFNSRSLRCGRTHASVRSNSKSLSRGQMNASVDRSSNQICSSNCRIWSRAVIETGGVIELPVATADKLGALAEAGGVVESVAIAKSVAVVESAVVET